MTPEDITRHQRNGTITALQAQVLHYRIRGISLHTIAIGMQKSKATIREHETAALRNIAAATTKEPTA